MTLTEGPVSLRPTRRWDRRTWESVRRRNYEWLKPWEPTPPLAGEGAPPTFSAMVGVMRSEARAGRMLPWVLTYDGRLVGQVTVSGITYGSLRAAHIGYWIDQQYAGHGLMPFAVAMACDHLLGTLRLHRVEIAMRVENEPSRRVAEKLGFRFEGVRPRYLHIDHAWRDHLVYALDADEVSGSLRVRLRDTPGAFHGEGDVAT